MSYESGVLMVSFNRWTLWRVNRTPAYAGGGPIRNPQILPFLSHDFGPILVRMTMVPQNFDHFGPQNGMGPQNFRFWSARQDGTSKSAFFPSIYSYKI